MLTCPGPVTPGLLTREIPEILVCDRGERSMDTLLQWTVDFLKREDGPTAVEYAVMMALIIVVCIAATATLGSNSSNTYT
jgi:pilus assembly protein Flp/PilA